MFFFQHTMQQLCVNALPLKKLTHNMALHDNLLRLQMDKWKCLEKKVSVVNFNWGVFTTCSSIIWKGLFTFLFTFAYFYFCLLICVLSSKCIINFCICFWSYIRECLSIDSTQMAVFSNFYWRCIKQAMHTE